MTSVEPEPGCLAESLHFQNHFIILNKLFGFYFMMFFMSLLLLQDFGRFFQFIFIKIYNMKILIESFSIVVFQMTNIVEKGHGSLVTICN